LQQLEQKQLSWTSFLTLLGNTLPADCQVTRLQQEKGKEHPGFSLEGRSLSRQAVLQFTKRLQKQPGISGIRLERLEEQPEENPSVQFALHGWWKAGDHET
jgi:Tfp pilus assembly protein PilN